MRRTQYDFLGHRVNASETEFSFDAYGRRVPTAPDTMANQTFFYDANRRPVNNRPNEIVTNRYDAFGRLESVTSSTPDLLGQIFNYYPDHRRVREQEAALPARASAQAAAENRYAQAQTLHRYDASSARIFTLPAAARAQAFVNAENNRINAIIMVD